MEVAMAKKATPPSTGAASSPQVTFFFNQLRAHGRSPAAAIKYLTDAIESKDAVPVPALPECWRLEADGDELFVVSPAGRRNAREVLLYKNRFKPVPLPPGVMDALYPNDAPAVLPSEENKKRSSAEPGSQPAMGRLARWQAMFNDSPLLPAPSQPVAPELTDALKRLPAELAAALKPPAPDKSGKTRRKRLQTLMAEAIVADIFPKERYPNGVPKEITTLDVQRMISENWKAKVAALPPGSKVPPAPEWGAVNRLIGRGGRR
jgi:hypothetical protein